MQPPNYARERESSLKAAVAQRGPARFTRLRPIARHGTPYLYLSPTLFLIILLLVVPIFLVIKYSFYDNVIINKNPVWVGLDNFRLILGDRRFHIAVRNTLLFVTASVLGHSILGLAFAMLLNNRVFSSKTTGVFRVIYVLPWMFTGAVIAILWQMMLNPNGVVNYLLSVTGLSDAKIAWLSSRKHALGAVTFMNIWAGYPFFMVSILAGLQGISEDLYEAAAIDGANGVQQFFRITIPQLRPILISLLTLDFVWTIFQFDLIWITTGGGPLYATETISTYIYKQGFSRFQYSQASAAAVLVLIACSIIAIFYAKQQVARD